MHLKIYETQLLLITYNIAKFCSPKKKLSLKLTYLYNIAWLVFFRKSLNIIGKMLTAIFSAVNNAYIFLYSSLFNL